MLMMTQYGDKDDDGDDSKGNDDDKDGNNDDKDGDGVNEEGDFWEALGLRCHPGLVTLLEIFEKRAFHFP